MILLKWTRLQPLQQELHVLPHEGAPLLSHHETSPVFTFSGYHWLVTDQIRRGPTSEDGTDAPFYSWKNSDNKWQWLIIKDKSLLSAII